MNPVLQEISEWKLEAKLENTKRYFFHVPDVESIENGKKLYVIGRKGTGKTAISEYLNNKSGPKTFSTKLTFKNFPFNELYELKNEKYRAPNQYITLWKYIIYSSIAKMMVENNNIDPVLRSKLSQIYCKEPVRTLARTISTWISAKFNINILGTGGGIEATKNVTSNTVPWIERVETLEDMLQEYLDDSDYRVVIDELDEDYKDVIIDERYHQYSELLTSLFKAVQDIRSIFAFGRYKISPVIFLRDDIYEILRDPDKTKWNDFRIDLNWDVKKIQSLLAFRISRAIDPTGKILKFNDAWDSIFSDLPVRYGNRQSKQMSSFDFITRSTLIRPRDYIRYIQACAESDKTKRKIYSRTVLDVDKSFSNYLRSEMEDEIHGVIPEIHQILDIMSHIRKQTFSVDEFKSAYNYEVTGGYIPDRNAEWVLKILFHFSLIGNQPKQKNMKVFRYENKEARLNLGEPICVHRGLFKAVQLF